MTFTEAAAEVLRLVGKPLHYKDITELAIQKNLLSHVGKSPEVTMGSRLAALLKKGPKENPLVRIKPGVFALRAWEESGPPGPAPEAEPAPSQAKAAEPESAPASEAVVAQEPTSEAVEASVTESAAAAVIAEVQPTQPVLPGVDEPAVAVAAGAASEAPSRADEAKLSVPDAAPAPAPTPSTPPAPSAPPATLAHHAAKIPDPRYSRPVSIESRTAPAPDEVMRADLAAGASDIFGEEDDDDQPILGGDPMSEGASGRRRRRRRRGRGAGGDESGLPSYTVSPAFGDAISPSSEPRAERPERVERPERAERPERVERAERSVRGDRGERSERGERRDEARFDEEGRSFERGEPQGEGDDVFGRDMVDIVLAVLSSYDRNGGAVSVRQLADTAQRRGRLQGDVQALASQMMAAARADNLRRTACGQRARFRIQGGRIALTDWGMHQDLLRLEGEALAAVERYREGCRKALTRKLTELPPHAFVELIVTLLERAGVSQLKAVKRPGAGGAEAHLSGVLKGVGSESRIAVVIRKDGRELGRERVIEARGAHHHYGPASAAWLITAGQVLSGAREEAAVAGALPVTLLDGASLARLCEEQGVAVIKAQMPIAIPDLDFFEAVRGVLGMNVTARISIRKQAGLGVMLGALLGATGCVSSAPPPSQFPSGQAAIDRMKATFACARGVRGDAKLDFKADRGRLRGNLLFYAVDPGAVRFDVVSPFGVALATLTSDGRLFSFNDMREKKFLYGPASTCNIARMTQVPIPAHALTQLLRGQAPVLMHQPEQATIRWDDGAYRVELPSTRDARQIIRLAPTPADFNKPWEQQRVRVLDVRVIQQEIELYHAELSDHVWAKMAETLVDEDGLEPPIPPSGPECSVEIPKRIHVAVTATEDDVQFRYEDVRLNPPLPEGIFQQPVPGGVQRIPVGECDL